MGTNDIFLNDSSKECNIFVVNEKLFKCNDRVSVCKYDPSEYKMEEIEKQSQIRLNSVNINGKMSISDWNKDTNQGGIIQIHCKQTLIIGKNGWINVKGCGYS